MGTETVLCDNYKIIKELQVVKLNNPLMGTETMSPVFLSTDTPYAWVKLNNPLMGTET